MREMNVDITQVPDLRVGAVRHVGPYDEIPEAFGRLGDIAGPAGLFGQPGATKIAIYHDDPESVPDDRLRSDAGVVVPESVTLPRGLDEQHVPAGTYARTIHVGPYEQLPRVWSQFIGEWLPASGHRAGGGATFELYRNDPGSAPRDQLRTELYLSIAD